MKFKCLILIPLLILLNGLFNIKVINVAVSLPEICIVLYLLLQKKTTKALFWHTIFFITSYSNNFTEKFLFDNNITSVISYNYANLGFHGIRISLILSLLILWVQHSRKKISESSKHTVFYKLFKFLLFCLITGFSLGVIGLLMLDYSFSKFLLYGYYILYCICFAYSYLFEYDSRLKDEFYEVIPYIISVAVIFNYFCWLFRLRESLIVIGTSGLAAYCFVLIPLILFRKKAIPILIVVGIEVFLMRFHTSGKQIYSLYILFIATIILSFTSNIHKTIGRANQLKIIAVLVSIMVAYPLLKESAASRAEASGGNYLGKMQSVETLTNFFTGQGEMSDVDDSPYIRLAEISNIVYEDVRNPIYLFFGRGFGGYYRDELQLFKGYDLTSGAFSNEEIKVGRYSYGHDTFVTVPMLNGFIGFFMLISLIVTMCKKSPQNYLYLSSLMFLLLWFYFDVLMGVFGVMLLYGAEHKVRKA